VLGVLRFLILAIILISVLRAVIGFVARFFLNAAVGPERSDSSPPSRPQAGTPEALKKDPVCGTFVAPSTALVKDKGGQTFYFCSTACRDNF
jgi:hypothetical protein